MIGYSRSQSRQHLISKPHAPVASSPGHSRVTRSQSRGLEEARGVSNDGQKKWGQSKILAPLVEESPLSTPQKSGVRDGNAAIPESPEDVANMSGTTILPEPETDLDPEMMVEALPDLERAGKDVLNFLTPSTAHPVSIVNKAKLLSDPRNTQSRRIRRLMLNLDNQTEYFGHQTYLDADGISRMISSAVAGRSGDFQDWSPDPIVHMANCARFAHEILLAGPSTNSRRQAIKNIENLFPLPFMSGLVAAGQEKAAGESSLEKDTFDLALEIRTQSLILQLEDHQHEPGFKPKSAIRLCFFQGSSRTSPLRGFNLPNLGGIDGTLPAHHRDTVQDRFNEILLSESEDGSIDIEELKGSYLWQRFVLRAAQWIRKRTEELNTELQKHASAQDVHDLFFNSKHPSFASTVGVSEAEPSDVAEVVEQETALQESLERETTTPPEQESESRTGHRDKERRRSSKPSFLNTLSIQRIMQRQERLRSETEISDNRRHSDIVRPVSQTVGEQLTTNRRQTTTAFLLDRPPQLIEPREASPFFEGSPTLLHEEPDFSIGNDSHLGIGDEGTQLERSHSPPVIRRSAAPAHPEIPSIDPEGALNKQGWRAVKTGIFAQPSVGPSRSARAAFIDRQRNAERVSPIGTSQIDSQSAVRRVEDRVSRKRARPPPEEETTSEDDLFVYDRPVDVERRRAEKPQQLRSKRRRLEEQEEVQGSANVSVDGDNDNLDAAPRPIGKRILPASVSTQVPIRELPVLSTRSRWTEPEDRRLKRLIGEYGTGWAKIERQNEAQPPRDGEVRIEGRNQVQLKDRARNLKIKYLRDGVPLPRYFDKVTMKEKDFLMLEKRGIAVRHP